MTVSTMEELEAVPVGQAIRLGNDVNQTWSRVAEGWSRNDVTITSEYLRGAVESGVVRLWDNAAPEAGDMFLYSGYTYLVMRVDAENKQATCVRFYENTCYGVALFTEWDQWTKIVPSDHPTTITPLVKATAERVLQQYDSYVRTEERDRLRQSARLDFDMVKGVLHSVAERVDDEVLDRALNQWGMPREKEMVLTALVSGYRDIPSDMLKSIISTAEGVEMRSGDVRLRWNYPVTFTHMGSGCVCSNAPSRDEVAAELPDDLANDTWAYTTTCSAH